MEKNNAINLTRKVIAVLLMVMMFACCIPVLSSEVYAASKTKIEIQITGTQKTVKYNGKERTVTGWTATSSYKKFKESKVEFTGTAEAKGTEIGTYKMGLKASMFSYNDSKVKATFVVTDGKLKIKDNRTPAKTKFKSITPMYESIKLKWKKVTSDYGDVYYQVRVKDSKGKTVKNVTTKKLTLTVPFDAYPGNKKGEGQNGKAKTAVCQVRSYVVVKDENGKKTKVYSDWVTQEDVEVIHPMYITVQPKSKCNIYKDKSSSKTVGKAYPSKKYVVIGGSRIDGHNKRVVIKVGGKLRYLKAEDVKVKKMYYNSKIKYSKSMIEKFVNTANNGKPLKSSPKTSSYGKALAWVNTYNQRVYLFAWKSGKWVIDSRYPKGVQCNTGLELTPYGVFKISTKWYVKEATGTKYWCILRGTGVGIHEKLGDALGKPASGGCVRVPDAVARAFYNGQLRVGHTVIVY